MSTNIKSRSLLALLMTVLLSLGFVSTAVAHDELISSTPEAQEQLDNAPEEVSLTFSGNLTTGQGIPNIILVRDANDENWTDGEAEVDGRTISVPVKEGMPDGEYRVSYRVVYSDGHPEEKMYTFTLGEQQATSESEEEPATSVPNPDTEESDSGNGSSTAIIVGVVVALLAALGILGARRRKRD